MTKFVYFLAAIAMLWTGETAYAEEMADEKPNHLALFVGNTEVTSEDQPGVTAGLEYERRISELISLGVLAEHAFGDVDATSILGTISFHLTEAVAIQTGAGVEIDHGGDASELVRIGLLYEFELESEFTLTPQIHFDFGEEEALVFGVAVGKKF